MHLIWRTFKAIKPNTEVTGVMISTYILRIENKYYGYSNLMLGNKREREINN